MAVFEITAATSVYITHAPAFNSDTPTADTLVVDPDAFLISDEVVLGFSIGIGADLQNTLAWTATINGDVYGNLDGIVLDGGNAAASKLAVSSDGEVFGSTVGLLLLSAATVTNAGTIAGDSGDGTAIHIDNSGSNAITNSGTITGGISGSGRSIDSVGSSNDTVTNSGVILGEKLDLGSGNDTVVNTGTISALFGGLVLGPGVNTVKNSGNIFGGGVSDSNFTHDGSGADTVTNSGKIVGAVDLGNGDNHFTNSGSVETYVYLGDNNDTVTNSGTIGDYVHLGDGTNLLTNSGSIAGDVSGGSGVDTITNSKIIQGDVTLAGGNDVFKNTGTIGGIVDLGSGDDTFTGGNNVDQVKDGDGSDNIKLGGGDDVYTATGNTGSDGADTIDGGAGVDTYEAFDANMTVFINLDTVAHALPAPYTGGTIAANTATDTVEVGTDHITNFENAFGGSNGSVIFGSAAANFIGDGSGGGSGPDYLYGLGGNDILNGGSNNDVLVGGAGKDVMHGNGGADTFVYTAVSDSGVGNSTRDVIEDFSQLDHDKIDLSAIDANTKNTAGTNDVFNFVNTNVAFSHTAGELIAYWSSTGQTIAGDTDGDGKANFTIAIFDPQHHITFHASDFVL